MDDAGGKNGKEARTPYGRSSLSLPEYAHAVYTLYGATIVVISRETCRPCSHLELLHVDNISPTLSRLAASEASHGTLLWFLHPQEQRAEVDRRTFCAHAPTRGRRRCEAWTVECSCVCACLAFRGGHRMMSLRRRPPRPHKSGHDRPNCVILSLPPLSTSPSPRPICQAPTLRG